MKWGRALIALGVGILLADYIKEAWLLVTNR